MKYLLIFLKYYTYGFLLALVMVVIVHLYGFFVDTFYVYQDFKLSFTTVLLIALPNGLHLWIINQLCQPKTNLHPYYKVLFKAIASYWLGIIISFVLLCLLQQLGTFITLSFANGINDENLFSLSFLFGVVVGLILYFKASFI